MTETVSRITVLALGLIGGSLAKALRRNGFANELVGWGRTESNLQKAVELGIIDHYSLDLSEAVSGADIVVIATPTLIAADMLGQLKPLVDENTIITDVASVKGNLLEAARQAFGDVPSNLVLAHPIAGSEKSGVEAANTDLFVRHRVIVTPVPETSPTAIALIENMWESVGAIVSSMNVKEHDDVLAATSHLPHILAYTLVDALAGQEEKQEIFKYAAGGFRDFTRIASSDPTMWQEISIANRRALLSILDVFTDHLQQLRSAIDKGDGESLHTCFDRAKRARDNFVGVQEKLLEQPAKKDN